MGVSAKWYLTSAGSGYILVAWIWAWISYPSRRFDRRRMVRLATDVSRQRSNHLPQPNEGQCSDRCRPQHARRFDVASDWQSGRRVAVGRDAACGRRPLHLFAICTSPAIIGRVRRCIGRSYFVTCLCPIRLRKQNQHPSTTPRAHHERSTLCGGSPRWTARSREPSFSSTLGG